MKIRIAALSLLACLFAAQPALADVRNPGSAVERRMKRVANVDRDAAREIRETRARFARLEARHVGRNAHRVPRMDQRGEHERLATRARFEWLDLEGRNRRDGRRASAADKWILLEERVSALSHRFDRGRGPSGYHARR